MMVRCFVGTGAGGFIVPLGRTLPVPLGKPPFLPFVDLRGEEGGGGGGAGDER